MQENKDNYLEFMSLASFEKVPEQMIFALQSREFAQKRYEFFKEGKTGTQEYIDMINEHFDKELELVNIIRPLLKKFAEKVKNYAESNFPDDLKNQHLWVLPEELYLDNNSEFFRLPFLLDAMKRKTMTATKMVDDLILDIVKQDNWNLLEQLIQKWKKENKIFTEERVQILQDCLSTIRVLDNKTAANVALPTLIAQIEGIWLDILDKNGIDVDNYYDTNRKKIDKITLNNQKKELENLTNNDKFQELSYDLLANTLFCDSKNMDSSFYFYRHKIMHGRCTKYNDISNVIKSFFILDFLYRIEAEKSIST